jgi:hypothetical protein
MTGAWASPSPREGGKGIEGMWGRSGRVASPSPREGGKGIEGMGGDPKGLCDSPGPGRCGLDETTDVGGGAVASVGLRAESYPTRTQTTSPCS